MEKEKSKDKKSLEGKDKTKKKRNRKKKITKVQAEKRKLLLSQILNKWVYFPTYHEDEVRYVYMYHRVAEENSYSKIEQIILSNDELQDGLYHITDFDIHSVYDNKQNKEIIQLVMKRFDLEIGPFAEKKGKVKDLQELKKTLVEKNYITALEFDTYSQSEKKFENVEEIQLAFPIDDSEDI